MVILKKIKSSSLIEVLVATVLIIVVFIVASLVLNNLFANVFKNNTHQVDNRINELQYLITHQQIELPYQEELGSWQIEIEAVLKNNKNEISIEAKNIGTNKAVRTNFMTYE